jgi:hypothetical protein
VYYVLSFYTGWNKKFSDRISAVQQELDELNRQIASENNNRQVKKARTRYRESDAGEDSNVDSGESSCEDEKNSANAQGEDDDSINEDQEVIEIDRSSSSSSSSDGSSSDDGAFDDTIDHAANESQDCSGSESGESNNDETSNGVNAADEHEQMDKDDTLAEPGSDADFDREDDDDDDEEAVIEETEQFYKSTISKSKLHMAVQGFQLQTKNQSNDRGMSATSNNRGNRAVFDPAVLEFEDKSFHKNKCYVLKGEDTTVGIQRFVSTDTALCILVVGFKHTILGEAGTDLMKDEYVQVFKCVKEISLSDLEKASDRVDQIPSLIYQAQTPGRWHSFGYFYDRTRARTLRRREHIRSLELFAGAGGSLQG